MPDTRVGNQQNVLTSTPVAIPIRTMAEKIAAGIVLREVPSFTSRGKREYQCHSSACLRLIFRLRGGEVDVPLQCATDYLKVGQHQVRRTLHFLVILDFNCIAILFLLLIYDDPDKL